MIILVSVNIEFCEFFCIVQGINATLCLSLREHIRLCSEQGGNLREKRHPAMSRIHLSQKRTLSWTEWE